MAESSTETCPNGHALRQGVAYCPTCGTAVATATPEPLSETQQVARHRTVLIMGAVAALLVVVGGVAFLVTRRDGRDSPPRQASVATTIKPKARPSTSATTVTMPSVRSFDFKNRTYDSTCLDRKVTLKDGHWSDPTGPGIGTIESTSVKYADVTGDGEEDAVVSMQCYIGVSTDVSGALVMQATADGPVQVGQVISGSVEPINGKLIGETPYYSDSDPHCCPSQVDQTTWVLDHGGWAQESVRRLPAAESFTYKGTSTPTTTTAPKQAWPPEADGQAGQFWAVYIAVAHSGTGQDKLQAAQDSIHAVGYQGGRLDVACDRGASEGLHLDPMQSYEGVAVYFNSEQDARTFVDLYQPGIVGTVLITAGCND